MITLDKGALPKKIGLEEVARFAGEKAYWYCSSCKQWRTSTIQYTGKVTCPICGGVPDWKKHQPLLAYESRYNRVEDLCAVGSEWRKKYDDTERRYGEFIEDIGTGLPLHTQKAGWRYFHNVWRAVDELADYLLTAPDVPTTDDNMPVYTERGLQRRYYDPRRKYNTSTLSDMEFPVLTDDGGTQFTDQEIAEIISLRSGHTKPFYDVYFPDELIECVSNQQERAIAYDLSRGATKREIERWYKLTEQQVRTKVSHIAKEIKKNRENCEK